MCRSECIYTCIYIVQLGRGDVGTSPACHLDSVLSPPTCLLLAYPGTHRCTQRHVVWPVRLFLGRHVRVTVPLHHQRTSSPLSFGWPGSYTRLLRIEMAFVPLAEIVFPVSLHLTERRGRRCLSAFVCLFVDYPRRFIKENI